jgi:hypothetical protein
MKRRNGFVSNSSSSSFISERPLPDLAIDMLLAEQKDEEHNWFGSFYSQKDITEVKKRNTRTLNAIKRAVLMADVLNGTYGICFHSCNYDTYISTKNNICYIDTCNNVDWSYYVRDLRYPPREEDVEEKQSGQYFVHIPNEIILGKQHFYCKSTGETKWKCPRCRNDYSWILDLNGNKHCSGCWTKMVEP